MCQCIFCEEEITSGQYALIGEQPMHESCVEEFNLEMYGNDVFECDEMVYEDDDRDPSGGYDGDDDYDAEEPDYGPYDGGYWEHDYDDELNFYNEE